MTLPETEVRTRLETLMGPDWHERRAMWTGSDLRAARRVLGLTQADAAEVIGCHPNCISLWETDRTSPHRRHRPAVFSLFALADRALEVGA